MKLIDKSNKQFLLLLIVLLSISSVVIFSLLNSYIKAELDEKLRNDEWRIIQKLKLNPHIISISPILEVNTTSESIERISEIKNVKIYDFIEKENEPYRELVSVKKINEKFYSIKVRQSTIENKDLLFAVGSTIFTVFAVLVIALFLINNRLSRKLWKPFYTNINRLKLFSFDENSKLELVKSDIDEFYQLNQSLEVLTVKLSKDYIALKEFTENASHEIQTPLSIVLMNIDEVLQHEQTEDNYTKLYSAFQAAKRLSNLNEKLLLLARLENSQKREVDRLNLGEIIQLQIKSLCPLIDVKEISINLSYSDVFELNIDKEIAEILIVNILSNAIKHNSVKGFITLVITKNSIHFTNSKASEKMINEEEIFHRFKKGNSDSVGLGLSIIQKICIVSQLTISIEQTDSEITFILKK